MRILYHFPLSPTSRKVRIVLGEKNLPFDLQAVNLAQPGARFMEMNPAAEVPVLEETDGTVISDGRTICEYLEETNPARPLLGPDIRQRAEIRRLVGWFDGKFAREVTDNLVGEKILKRVYGQGTPNSAAIRDGLSNIHFHLSYLNYLAETRNWLAGDFFSLADITAAAHLSSLDYLGDVPWGDYPEAKMWYARVKSRPSFRGLLGDVMPGIVPSAHYADVDF